MWFEMCACEHIMHVRYLYPVSKLSGMIIITVCRNTDRSRKFACYKLRRVNKLDSIGKR